jgi:hypothetical protein
MQQQLLRLYGYQRKLDATSVCGVVAIVWHIPAGTAAKAQLKGEFSAALGFPITSAKLLIA